MILLIETSIHGANLGLAAEATDAMQNDGRGVRDDLGVRMPWYARWSDVPSSGTALPRLLAEGMAAASCSPASIRGIIVSTGPGSFTGIKIGIGFATGLAFGWDRPMAGCCGLALAAKELLREIGSDSCALCLPATASHGFCAIASDKDGEQFLLEAEDHAVEKLGEVDDVLLAKSWPTLEMCLSARDRRFEVLGLDRMGLAVLSGMSKVAWEMWPDGFHSQPPHPRYLRLSTAEERLADKRSLGDSRG